LFSSQQGFFLEGCAWDASRKMLSESKPKVLFEEAPVIWLQPRGIDDFTDYPHYSCPGEKEGGREGGREKGREPCIQGPTTSRLLIYPCS
jgi:hypothetical protein